MGRLIATLLACAILAGCAAPKARTAGATKGQVDQEEVLQRNMVIQRDAETRRRLDTVWTKLRISAADLCDNKAPVMGLYPMESGANETATAIQKLYKLPSGLSAWLVPAGSPAAKAGLQQADLIRAINGVPVKSVKEVTDATSKLETGKAVKLGLTRDGQEKDIEVVPVAGCAYALEVGNGTEINAYADGKKIVVTRGMLDFIQTDEELALVVSHELAHNMMKHIDAKQTNAVGGLFADVALAVLTRGAYRSTYLSSAAGGAFSQEFESEADYVGLYLMARAGYPIEDAPKFWRRMAVAFPANIKTSHTASHPSTANRMAALDNTVAEIQKKKSTGAALTPNLKEQSADKTDKAENQKP